MRVYAHEIDGAPRHAGYGTWGRLASVPATVVAKQLGYDSDDPRSLERLGMPIASLANLIFSHIFFVGIPIAMVISRAAKREE